MEGRLAPVSEASPASSFNEAAAQPAPAAQDAVADDKVTASSAHAPVHHLSSVAVNKMVLSDNGKTLSKAEKAARRQSLDIRKKEHAEELKALVRCAAGC